MNKPKCTCPCIECIEGNHCGGFYYWPDADGNEKLIGVCEHIPCDYDEKERQREEYEWVCTNSGDDDDAPEVRG